jgi:hypothetical protein
VSETPIYDAVCREVSPLGDPEVDDESATAELSIPGNDRSPPDPDGPEV